jgi:hypothetical protein
MTGSLWLVLSSGIDPERVLATLGVNVLIRLLIFFGFIRFPDSYRVVV